MRSAIVGAILAVVVVTGTITFGASLHTLGVAPGSYGWNWDYELLSGFSGQEDLPQPSDERSSTTTATSAPTRGLPGGRVIDGRPVPSSAPPVSPVATAAAVRSRLDRTDQVVLGVGPVPELHSTPAKPSPSGRPEQAGDTLRIVGTATMPAIGDAGMHKMGTGALFLQGRTRRSTQLNKDNKPDPRPERGPRPHPTSRCEPRRRLAFDSQQINERPTTQRRRR